MMGMYEVNFLASLLSIVIIDLVLAGDNALVIGLAARRLPKKQQKKVILWGTFGAVAIRSTLTIVAVYLLNIPGLRLVGGILLVWIAYKLLAEKKGNGKKRESVSFRAALRTVLIADTVMSLDNVLAVAGAARGNFILVISGLLISIPIVVWGSTIILRLVQRYPFITYVGAGVIGWTAGSMIVDERIIERFFAENPVFKTIIPIVIIVGVLAAGWLKRQGKVKKTAY